jgi:hypothetical protein
MKQELALRLLANVMGWSTETCRQEYTWLRLASRVKYDTYRDFTAGVLFVESLADWLQQFEPSERQTAYDFVRHHLIFLSPLEMQHLVELLYPEQVRDRLIRLVADKMGIPKHLIWASAESKKGYNALLRRTLFLGLSDGARMDAFRRANSGTISNEQVMIATELDDSKWKSAVKSLRKDTSDPAALFEVVYLIDDFAGSGKTCLRKGPEGMWEGKLAKFHNRVKELADTFAPGMLLCVHHYVASDEASKAIPAACEDARKDRPTDWYSEVEFSFGTILPPSVRVADVTHGPFMALVNKYYDPAIESTHTGVGGTNDVRLGFGACALPLVLEHNTPNNSIALLWADTEGAKGTHAMRPLFRRRQRHA